MSLLLSKVYGLDEAEGKAAAAMEERRPLLRKRRWRSKRQGRGGGSGVNAASAMERGIIIVSLVYILCVFYFIRIISFVDRSIEERGGGVKGWSDAAAERTFSYFVIYESHSPFLFILFS